MKPNPSTMTTARPAVTNLISWPESMSPQPPSYTQDQSAEVTGGIGCSSTPAQLAILLALENSLERSQQALLTKDIAAIEQETQEQSRLCRQMTPRDWQFISSDSPDALIRRPISDWGSDPIGANKVGALSPCAWNPAGESPAFPEDMWPLAGRPTTELRTIVCPALDARHRFTA